MPRFLLAFAVLLAAAGLAVAQTPPQPAAGQAVATFAGGCFWCTEADFDKAVGVQRAAKSAALSSGEYAQLAQVETKEPRFPPENAVHAVPSLSSSAQDRT